MKSEDDCGVSECESKTPKEIRMSFNLSIPSNNTYYRNFRGHMCMSPQGRVFKTEIAKLLEGCPKILGPVAVDLVFRWSDLRSRDIDNYYKATLDGIKNKLFEDDSQIQDLRGRKVCGNKKLQNGFELVITSYDPSLNTVTFPPSAYVNGVSPSDDVTSEPPKKKRTKTIKNKSKNPKKTKPASSVSSPTLPSTKSSNASTPSSSLFTMMDELMSK